MATRPHSDSRRPVYEDVCEQIHALIRKGELAVGAKLPPERMLAAQFNVSRNSVREALRVLAENRVVESRHGDGTYIRSLDETDRVTTLAAVIEKQSTRLREIFQFRRILEPQIAFLAALSITRQELEHLKVLVFEQNRRRVLGQSDEDLDSEFHLAVARATKNAVIVEVLKALTGILSETRSMGLRGADRQFVSLSTHILIVDALERKDPDAAWQAMERHLKEIEHMVLGDAPTPRDMGSC